jgi:hypothetical protein
MRHTIGESVRVVEPRTIESQHVDAGAAVRMMPKATRVRDVGAALPSDVGADPPGQMVKGQGDVDGCEVRKAGNTVGKYCLQHMFVEADRDLRQSPKTSSPRPNPKEVRRPISVSKTPASSSKHAASSNASLSPAGSVLRGKVPTDAPLQNGVPPAPAVRPTTRHDLDRIKGEATKAKANFSKLSQDDPSYQREGLRVVLMFLRWLQQHKVRPAFA